jgi:UDP:flavonoid glycosyltransferase YjiC (YdhE family)
MRILITWCNGGNWGHVSRQLAFARHAAAIGAEVLWAVPARHARAMATVRARGSRVLVHTAVRAPPSCRQGTPRSYADILVHQGFGDAASLHAQTVSWLDLYAQVRPDRVVIDYAPAAQLATQLAGLPALQLTNGFDSPPADCPPYEAGVRGPYLRHQAATAVQTVEHTLHMVAARVAPSTCTSLRGLIEYPHRLMDCVEESDPYAVQRAPSDTRRDYVGPLGEAPDAAPAQWPASPGSRRVFAYLRGDHPHFRTVLSALEQANASVLCVWPDASEAAAAYFTNQTRMRMVREPVQAASALAQADAVVNYASSTFVCQTLLAGKPQLMLPTDHEKVMVGGRVVSLGLGVLCREDDAETQVQEMTQTLLEDTRMRDDAQAAAARYGQLCEHASSVIRAALQQRKCGARATTVVRVAY